MLQDDICAQPANIYQTNTVKHRVTKEMGGENMELLKVLLCLAKVRSNRCSGFG